MMDGNSRAQLFAELYEPLSRGKVEVLFLHMHAKTSTTDFDPEEDAQPQEDDDSGSEENDDLAGTEHYVDVGYAWRCSYGHLR